MDILDILAEDNGRVSYRPRFAKALGSITRALLLQQILYRWKNNGRKAFYKFKEPCKHRLYKEGDSWLEELGFSRREFDSALDFIAQKISIMVPKDPAKLVWYWIDADRITHYDLNWEAFYSFVNDLYVTAESATRKSAKAPLLIADTTPEKTTDISFAETGVPAPKVTKTKVEIKTLEQIEIETFGDDGPCPGAGWYQSWKNWKEMTLIPSNKTSTMSNRKIVGILMHLLDRQEALALSPEAMRYGLEAAIARNVPNENYAISAARGYRG